MLGVTERVSTRMEIKFLDYYYGFTFGANVVTNPGTAQALLWTSDSSLVNISSQQYNPNPQQSITLQSGITGREWLYCGVDLRFTIAVRNAALTSGDNNNLLRLLIVKNKQAGIGGIPDALNMPTAITTPVNSKIWNVLMDKTFPFSTGYCFIKDANPTAGTSYNLLGHITPASMMREYRFKIPWRVKGAYPTGTYTPTIAQQFRNENNVYVILYSKFACDDIFYNDVNARIYFKDI